MWIFPQFSTLNPNFESLVYCHDMMNIFLESLWHCDSKMSQKRAQVAVGAPQDRHDS